MVNQAFLPMSFVASTTFFFLALQLFGGHRGGVEAGIAPQDKMKNFTIRYVTPFLTLDQHYALSKLIATGFSQDLTQDAIYNTIYNYFMASLTSSQLSSAVQYGFCLMFSGMSTSTALLVADQAATAIGMRLRAVYNQTLTKVRSMKAAGRGPNAIAQQVYRICAQFESQSNVCILMTGAKNAMSLSNWALFRKCLSPVIRYTNCGY